MGYRFDEPDRVERALRRIAREQTEKALRSIDRSEDDLDACVHDVRKRCKKIRGLLRLVRPGFDGYRRENARFRDAARMLSGLRDAATMIECIDALEARFESEAEAASLERLKRVMRSHRRNVRDDAGIRERLDACGCELRAGLEAIDDWTLNEPGFAALAAGLEKTYDRGRAAMHSAYEDPTPEAFHDWRKRVKYTGYHLRLLGPAWPAVIGGLEDQFGMLADLLGAEHDLSVLRDQLAAELPEGLAERDGAALLAIIDRRRVELRGLAHPLGSRVYAEKPAAFVRRMSRLWSAWGAERIILDSMPDQASLAEV